MNWQYKTIVLPSSEQRENMLTEMGLNGWELVGFEQGLAYFKRPKAEVSGLEPVLEAPPKQILKDIKVALRELKPSQKK